MNAEQREEFVRRLQAENPEPKGELNYASHFQLLVAVILSAQATDTGVNKATARLFPVAPDAQTMLALGEEGLAGYIKTIGLFRSKARNVIATCRQLLEKHGGEVPSSRAALESLPAASCGAPWTPDRAVRRCSSRLARGRASPRACPDCWPDRAVRRCSSRLARGRASPRACPGCWPDRAVEAYSSRIAWWRVSWIEKRQILPVCRRQPIRSMPIAAGHCCSSP